MELPVTVFSTPSGRVSKTTVMDLSQNDRHRWVSSGWSADTDAHVAGKEAAGGALRGRDDPKLVIAFCSEAYDLHRLLAAINETSGGVPLIGCSTAGEIAVAGPADSSVVVLAFGGDGFTVATGAGNAASTDLRQASVDAVQACRSAFEQGEHRMIVLLTDGLGGDQMEVVRGAYSVVGAEIPLVGGCAGDDLKMKRTYQLFNDQVLQDSVIAAAVSSDAPLGIGVRHGWRKVGDAMLVSSSGASRVYTLNDEPALDEYLRRLDAPAAARHDADAFTRFAMTHPLGISRRSGEEVRFVAGADFEERSLVCIAQVPQGGLAWMMEGDDDSVLEATDLACSDALSQLDGPPLALVAFDCIARKGVLGDSGIRSEISRIATFAGGAPVAGFYTYGEIARTKGVSGFHNQTLVVLAVG